MALTDDLISQFVKITKDDKETKGETTVYGTLVEQGGKQYVRIDGSELLTPISTTVNVKPGERVVVMIKNHSAVVTGNTSSPSARTGDVEGMADDISNLYDEIQAFEIITAGLVTADEMQVERGRIDTLFTENVTIRQRLTASEGSIDTLETNYISINNKLVANDAVVEDLQANKIDVTIADAKYATISDLDAMNARVYTLESTYGDFVDLSAGRLTAVEAVIDNLDTTYANLDFSNIGQAAMEYFYSKSGLIEDVSVGDATISGKLVGVTISGDLIEGNTVKADKLVIKGSDGLYYKLNTDGMTTEAQQTDQNSLNGSIIKAKSITASKVNVTDLVAFGATIGGFHISNTSLYSGVKTSVDNATRGIYLDSYGQMAVGDASNFIRYYKDDTGAYKLAISAESIIFAASNRNVETTINDMVEDLSVSGRNLIIRRDERLNTYVLASGEVIDCEASYRSATVLNPIKIEGGQTYTFSKDKSAVEYFRWAWYDKDMTVIGRTADNASVFTWTAPENAVYVIVSYPYTQGSNVKMEKGNVATSYCPALEDIGYSISELNTRIDKTANDAKAAIDDMEIGGRNLIKNSNFANGIDKWTPTGVTYDIDTDHEHGTYIKFSSTAAGASEHRIYPETVTNFNHSRGTFTLSFYAKTDAACTLQTNVAGSPTYSKNYQLTTAWTKFTHTYDCTSTGSLTFWLNDANTNVYLTKIKLERGDKPTDWTPAPEDVASSEDVQKAQSSADEAKTIADDAMALIAQLSNSISMLVTDGNGTSLMTQTDEGWTFSTADIMTAVNNTSQGLNDLTKTLGDTSSVVNVLQQAVDDLSTIAEYVKIGTYEDEPCIELGEGDSEFKLRITNTRVIFTEGSNVLAYFNNQSLHIKKAVVEDELQQGEFVWKVRSNGNLGLVWKGGTS